VSFSTLNIGASALYAAQRAVDVAANNVSNANTSGYTRQRVTLTAAMPTYGTAGARGSGDISTGVTITDVARLRDRLADVSYRSEAAVSGATTARSDTLSRASSVLGTFASGTPEDLSTFITSWDRLSTTPDDAAARAAVLNSGQHLADSLTAASAKLDALTGEVGLRLADDTGELNGLLSSVAKLNEQIAVAYTDARQPNDLQDQRDVALDRISALTGARIDPRPDGSVTISSGGIVLVSGRVAQSVASSTSPAGITLADGTPLPVSGEMGGYTSALAVDLPAYRSQLDAFAVALRDSVNTAHAGGSGTDGSTGIAFFTGSGASDLTVNPSLLPSGIAASETGATTDGNNAIVIAQRLRTATPLSGQTLGNALAAFGARLGQAATDASRNATTAAASLTSAQAARASADGVSVDEEMVDLVKFQHSYQAAAKVISMADGMLDTLINNMMRG
jgi:flagellar hook-associated protein 1 FlgK